MKKSCKIHNFWATIKFFLDIIGVAQNFWFNGGGFIAQKGGAEAPPWIRPWKGYMSDMQEWKVVLLRKSSFASPSQIVSTTLDYTHLHLYKPKINKKPCST